MTTILVPTSGTQTDIGVFATALALAQPLRAHMQFYHLRLTSREAAERSAHVDFRGGAGVGAALDHLERRDEALSSSAARAFLDFCERRQIPLLDSPAAARGELSAQWLEETNDSEDRLMFHARHSDLTVLGRRHNTDLMPPNLIESLLVGSGRPVIVVPDSPTGTSMRTIVVGWKETGECARALTAAMPLLVKAQRVFLVTAEETLSSDSRGLDHLVRQLAWNGVAAEARTLCESIDPVARQLTEVAAEVQADLLVVGGFGHSLVREHMLGGVTRDLLEDAKLPVLMMH
jgi:nucleotide-binding universal stress UspA family protein